MTELRPGHLGGGHVRAAALVIRRALREAFPSASERQLAVIGVSAAAILLARQVGRLPIPAEVYRTAGRLVGAGLLLAANDLEEPK